MAGAGAVVITATAAAGVIAVAMDTAVVATATGEAGTLPAASAVDTAEAGDAKIRSAR